MLLYSVCCEKSDDNWNLHFCSLIWIGGIPFRAANNKDVRGNPIIETSKEREE